MKRNTSIIIPACNEEKRIGGVVRRLIRWQRCLEVIVVANGCHDKTARVAKREGARVIEYVDVLGPDVGRAIGLTYARGDVLLVVDADLLLFPRQLSPFVLAVNAGVDVALNRYPLSGTRQYQHPTAIAKYALNLFANRPDLAACSLTAVPHALSRRVVEQIGAAAFAVPSVAQVQAILAGSFLIKPVVHIPVGRLNLVRSVRHERRMRDLIIGDCLEAIGTLYRHRGLRGGFTDLNRQRDIIPIAFRNSPELLCAQTLAVVPTQDERSLAEVVRTLVMAQIEQVVIVQNGSATNNLSNETYPREHGVTTLHYADVVGHDVGRAIGCAQQRAEGYLFTDADIPIDCKDMAVFLEALSTVDVALNRLDEILPKRKQTDAPSIVKRFVNLACNRPDLGVASLTAIPHAMQGRVVETIGLAALAVPPLAQVKALLAGFIVKAVHPVDVVHRNVYRPSLHSSSSGRSVAKLIIGDCLEALHFLQSEVGMRTFFPDDWRRRDLLPRPTIVPDVPWNKHPV